jgi:hypothetical protein
VPSKSFIHAGSYYVLGIAAVGTFATQVDWRKPQIGAFFLVVAVDYLISGDWA